MIFDVNKPIQSMKQSTCKEGTKKRKQNNCGLISCRNKIGNRETWQDSQCLKIGAAWMYIHPRRTMGTVAWLWNMVRDNRQSLPSRPRREHQIAQGLAENHHLGSTWQAFRGLPYVWRGGDFSTTLCFGQVGYVMCTIGGKSGVEKNHADSLKRCSLIASLPNGAIRMLPRSERRKNVDKF